MQPRDLIGYGGNPPHPHWPDEARVAVQFVLNIEEGAEQSIVNGDSQSESYLHELPGRPVRISERDLSVESMYEYGSRTGFWRILRLFNEHQVPLTAFAVGKALELNPDIGKALVDGGHEIAGHGYRWINYDGVAEDEEREHIDRTIAIIQDLCGDSPVGWYTGRVSQNTRQLLREHEKILYLSDAYNDDLPYWLDDAANKLVIPYSLVCNDMHYLLPNGCASGSDFLQLLKDSFDLLWQEGAKQPKMMSIGLHCRISGHPGRAMAVARFLDYIREREAVWICRRNDVARHWMTSFPR